MLIIDCQILILNILNGKMNLTVGVYKKNKERKTKMKFDIKDFTDPGLLETSGCPHWFVVVVLPSQVFLLLIGPV